jgi:DNA adenine methylase
MANTNSPLRYPGGKTKLYPLVHPIVDRNIPQGVYIEPFAGGGGLALELLFKNHISNVILNDIDYSIFCFWKACLTQTDEFCELIDSCKINIDNWNKQKQIYTGYSGRTILEIGFATFFLNRCNVSGVIRGGPIGGKEQKGVYSLDARFNKKKLIEKIKQIGDFKDSIQIYNENASTFLKYEIKKYPIRHTMLNIDPPYVKKGKMLYENSFEEEDHIELSNVIKSLKHKWIVTYDLCTLVQELYEGYPSRQISLNYSAGQTKKGNELIIFSPNTSL